MRQTDSLIVIGERELQGLMCGGLSHLARYGDEDRDVFIYIFIGKNIKKKPFKLSIVYNLTF
jgi:hypothetical protein